MPKVAKFLVVAVHGGDCCPAHTVTHGMTQVGYMLGNAV